MHLVVNHLTRMQPGYICLAGLKLEADAEGHFRLAIPNEHVRPVIEGRLSVSLLQAQGGPLAVGSLIDLGHTQHVGQAPEVEDYLFESQAMRLERQTSDRAFWQGLRRVACPALLDIFGPALQVRGGSAVVKENQGRASLGVLAPRGEVQLFVDGWGKLRLGLGGQDQQLSLAVTDVRFYRAGDDWELRRDVAEAVAERMQAGVKVFLSMGLTRAWQKPGDEEVFHWLQVNNIHLSDRPIW